MLVLASASPRRRELLAQLGCEVAVIPSAVHEERAPGESPAAYARRLAWDKAHAVAARRDAHVTGASAIVAADTIVVIDGAVLEKPAGRADAERIIALLAGRTHEVITAVCVMQPGAGVALERFEVSTRVTFRPLDAREIAGYCATREPYDKAGAYAAQGIGASLIARIDGSYTNVVGLPLAETVQALQRHGLFDPFAAPAP